MAVTAPALPLFSSPSFALLGPRYVGSPASQPQRSRHRPPSPAADYYERAVNAAQAGAALQGRLALEPLLHRPRLPREQRAFAYFLRGLLFYRDQLFVSAAQDYQRALEFDPSHAPAQNALAAYSEGPGGCA